MPFDISKYAKALPAILGLKERGRGIPQLADQAVGILDIGQLYLLDNRELVTFTTITTAALGVNVFTEQVPPGELWYVWFLSIGSSPGAGEAIDLAAAYNPEGMPLSYVAGYVAGTANQVVQTALGPFWAGPGTKFGFAVRSQTLTPDVGGNAIVTKLKV